METGMRLDLARGGILILHAIDALVHMLLDRGLQIFDNFLTRIVALIAIEPHFDANTLKVARATNGFVDETQTRDVLSGIDHVTDNRDRLMKFSQKIK